MVFCVFQATNLVNNYRPRKSARTIVSRLEQAINYIQCWAKYFIIHSNIHILLNLLSFLFLFYLRFL